ncbi:MAG: acetyl-CoA synthetase, partial [Desulfobacteraceae bacterium]
MMGHLKKILNPRAVALIGATEKMGTIPNDILHNLTTSYKGKIFPVNPHRSSVQGLKCYPTIDALPESVDLAVIAVKAVLVPDIIKQCGETGTEGALIISAGFSETGEAGRQLENRILEISRQFGMRIIGPGSIGIIRPDIGLNTSFLKVNPEPGNIAFIQQRGELGDATLKWSVEAGIGFSTFASLGSMIDVDFGDMIDFLGDDDHTRSI